MCKVYLLFYLKDTVLIHDELIYEETYDIRKDVLSYVTWEQAISGELSVG